MSWLILQVAQILPLFYKLFGYDPSSSPFNFLKKNSENLEQYQQLYCQYQQKKFLKFFNKISSWKYSPLQKIFKMTSVNNNVIGNDLDNVIDINNVNYDVFAMTFLWGNFSDPFYSAFKKLVCL